MTLARGSKNRAHQPANYRIESGREHHPLRDIRSMGRQPHYHQLYHPLCDCFPLLSDTCALGLFHFVMASW